MLLSGGSGNLLVGVGRPSIAGCPGMRQVGLSLISSPLRGGMELCDNAVGGVNHQGRPRPGWGVMKRAIRADRERVTITPPAGG
jgi:hypothetical protein